MFYQSDLEEVGFPTKVACDLGVGALGGVLAVAGAFAWWNKVPFFAELFLWKQKWFGWSVTLSWAGNTRRAMG